MHAVVLVGGFGTRLRPLTLEVPKPMLPIGHVPMIVRLVDRLAAGGVTDVVLALGFKPEPFAAAFPGGRHRSPHGSVRLHYAIEPSPLDTAGAIAFAASSAGIDATFVVANGDIQTDLDVGHLVLRHRDLAAEATLHLVGVADPSAFGVVDIDADSRVRAFVEKPAPGTEPSSLINAGTYVFEPSMIDRIPVGVASSIERDVFPLVAADGALFGVATDDYWIDAGRPDLYIRANLDLLDGARRLRCDPVATGADVDASATIERSIVAAAASVGAGARIVDSVILDGAVVGAGATVQQCAVMGRVGRSAIVARSVLGASADVAPGASVADALVPDP
jgi:mannose-1-phosphate guanylyltransferase